MLRRLGKKTKLAPKIISYFPEHSCYIELFFGAGGLFFNKPPVQYNFMNDIDNDVYNLFMVLKNSPDDLYNKMEMTPYHESIFKKWKTEKEIEPVWQAVRFLYLSNFSYLGKSDTLGFGMENSKKEILKKIKLNLTILDRARFLNNDFREVIKKISFHGSTIKKINSFIYADPPYLGKGNNYSQGFTEKDSIDLFNVLTESGVRFAMSEFNNPFIIDQAKQRNLNIIEIGERQTLKSRQTEILITNYEINQGVLF